MTDRARIRRENTMNDEAGARALDADKACACIAWALARD